MEIIQRLPLTMTALVSFGTFSLASLGFKALIKYYNARKRLREEVEIIANNIPGDMWNEIFKHILTDATDAELLQLSLINKYTHEKIDALYTSKIPEGVLLPQFNEYLTPKRFYYFNKGRNVRLPEGRNRARVERNLIRIPQDFELKTKYGPWLDHSLLRHPENFWLFLKAVVLNPDWMLPLLVKSKFIQGFAVDSTNQKRLLKHVNLCSLLLSYLPYLDSIVYQYRTSMPETALVSATSFLWHLWQCDSWKISTQLRWLSQLAIFQLFDDAFYNFKGGAYRLALLIPFIFMNGGVKNLLIFAAILFVGTLIWRAREKWKPAEYIAEAIGMLAALWFYPVPSIFSCIAGLVMFVDVLLRIAPTVGTMMFTRVVLFGAIGFTTAIIFWR